MLLSDLRVKNKALTKLWIVIGLIQISFFIITATIVACIEPNSSYWLWEFLTFTKGAKGSRLPNLGRYTLPTIWFLISLVITAIDFLACYSVHHEIMLSFQRTYSFKETIIITKMKRHLNLILIFMLLALFMQMLNGALWWVTGITVLSCKYLYFKEQKHLGVCNSTFPY